MSAKKLNRKVVNSSEYVNYQKSAEDFFSAASHLVDEKNFSAAAVLIVHSAIAYTDAVTVKFGSQRSSGEQHSSAVELVRQILEVDEEDERALARLNRLLAEKTKVSYTGMVASPSEISNMFKNLERYRDWAKRKLS